jgi:mono/diheme cytochrome c family protein
VFSPARILLFTLTPQTALAALVLLLGALLFSQRGRARRRQRLPLAFAGYAMGLVGMLFLGVSLARAYTLSVAAAQPRVNPIAASPDSLARGQQLYTESCLACHGPQGRGDGPIARTLRPPPADLREHMAAGHTDAELFEWITNGIPGTAMPAWKDQLPPDDRWHVINYLRTFAGLLDQTAPAVQTTQPAQPAPPAQAPPAQIPPGQASAP